MNFRISGRNFLICGASSGLGQAIAKALLAEGANITAVARRHDKLRDLSGEPSGRISLIVGDLFQDETIEKVVGATAGSRLDGVLINAGGPPAMSFLESTLTDWDDAYRTVLRWKVALVKALLPKLLDQGYGRLVFIESMSVKQPVENLVLSNAYRMSVAGFVKTLSQEVVASGITANILAPGFHDTPALERIFRKRAELERITLEEARMRFESEMRMGRLGDASDFASLALWLLAPISGYVTGQVFYVDGGLIKSVV